MSITQPEGPITGATTDDPFATLRRRRRGVRVTTAAAVALGLAISGGSVAAATSPSSGRHPEIRREARTATRRHIVGPLSNVVLSPTSTGSEVPT